MRGVHTFRATRWSATIYCIGMLSSKPACEPSHWQPALSAAKEEGPPGKLSVISHPYRHRKHSRCSPGTGVAGCCLTACCNEQSWSPWSWLTHSPIPQHAVGKSATLSSFFPWVGSREWVLSTMRSWESEKIFCSTTHDGAGITCSSAKCSTTEKSLFQNIFVAWQGACTFVPCRACVELQRPML